MVASSLNVAIATFSVALNLVLLLEGCGGGGDTQIEGTCGKESPSTVKDCQNVDFGSCGNACCNLMLTVDQSPDDVVDALKAAASKNTLGGQFALQITAENETGFANLTAFTPKLPAPFKDSERLFIGQLHHETSGPKHYVDTINIDVRNGTNGSSIVHAFSLSLIGGALGDNGQNFKNIMLLLEGMDFKVTEHLNNSCPAAKDFNPQTPTVHVSRSLSMKSATVNPALKAKVNGTCGKEKPSPVADCQNVDFGSCGNACCSLLLQTPYEPSSAVEKINDTLNDGGPDGGFTLQVTDGDKLGYDNLTGFIHDLPAPFTESTEGVYIGQVHHMTSGPEHYNDTISFVVWADDKDAGSLIRVTSVSLIGGALGDNGQNYKNIIMAMSGLPITSSVLGRYFNSCPAPSFPSEATNLII